MSKKLLAQITLGNLTGPGEIGSFGFAETPLASLERVISWVIGLMTIGGGIYFLFVLIIAAYNWMNAGGDKQKLEKAQHSIIHALIGIGVVIAAYAVVSLVGYVFGFCILQPASLLGTLWSPP